MMKTLFFVALVILTIASVNGQVNPECDPSTGISSTDCEEYIEEGAITVTFDGRSEELTDVETELFKEVIANVSNEYVLLEVLPEHVTIVQRVRNTNTNEFGLVFFVLNPSGSTYMPVALRRQELYLMVKLNNADINGDLGPEMDVTAQAPPSTYPLAIPAWAIAIIGYVGLVIFVYCIMVLTREWRQKMADDFEASLEKEYYANTNGMNGVSVGDEIPMKKIPAGEDDGYEVVVETKRNGELKQKTIGVQTPRHVAVQVDPADVMLSQSSPAPSQTSTTEVVIENGHSMVDEEAPYDSPDAPDTAHIVPMTTDGDRDKEADDAAAAIEGAINEGFAADESDVTQPSTNL